MASTRSSSASTHRARTPSLFMLLAVLLTFVLGVVSTPVNNNNNCDDMSDNDENRFPSDQQTAQQKAAFAEAEKLVLQTFGSGFKLKDAQGNLLGPFGILSYSPSTFIPYLNYTQSYTTLTALTPKERELSVLATASITKSEYILYAHKAIAVTVGLSKDQASAAGEGKIPSHLSDRERFVYVLAQKLAKRFGVISDDLFDEAVAEIGREGVAMLAQVVGGYLLSSVLVSTANVQVPAS